MIKCEKIDLTSSNYLCNDPYLHFPMVVKPFVKPSKIFYFNDTWNRILSHWDPGFYLVYKKDSTHIFINGVEKSINGFVSLLGLQIVIIFINHTHKLSDHFSLFLLLGHYKLSYTFYEVFVQLTFLGPSFV